MNRHDRKRWSAARDFADLGELVAAWLNGEVQQTPSHLGPPDPETIPLIPALTAANLAGFVTDNSQQAGEGGYYGGVWEAWVCGFVPNPVLPALEAAVASTRLELGACWSHKHCDHEHFGARRCPWRENTGFWTDRCPAVAREIRGAWYVIIQDPVPGRNDVLWPALERFAAIHAVGAP